MIEEEAPVPQLKPRERGDVDRAAFAERWQQETTDAAKAQIQDRVDVHLQDRNEPDHAPDHSL